MQADKVPLHGVRISVNLTSKDCPTGGWDDAILHNNRPSARNNTG